MGFTTMLARGSSLALRTARPFATLAERSVMVTFIERDGQRKQVRGMVGKTLPEVAQRNGIDLQSTSHGNDWELWGEGPSSNSCEVNIPRQFLPVLPERRPAEESVLSNDAVTTRLGSYIKLTKDMEGLVVVLGNVGVPEAVRNFDIP